MGSQNGRILEGMVEDFSTIQDRLRKALDERGWDIATLSRQIPGLSHQSVYKWFSGETRFPRPDHLFLVADLLEVDARWLATGEGQMKREEDYNRLAEQLTPEDRDHWREVGYAFAQLRGYNAPLMESKGKRNTITEV